MSKHRWENTQLFVYMVLREMLKKTSNVFRYLQSSTDIEGKILITDVILHSGMERDQEYISKQHFFTYSFLTSRDRKILLASRLPHGFRDIQCMSSCKEGYFPPDSPIPLTSILDQVMPHASLKPNSRLEKLT